MPRAHDKWQDPVWWLKITHSYDDLQKKLIKLNLFIFIFVTYLIAFH